jgi:glycosyltransferase involved in cell wall biosynthesis
MKRLFVIEPGLVNCGGHPIQYALTINQYCDERGIPLFVFCRNTVDDAVRQRVPRLFPILQHHTFPVLAEADEGFSDALAQVDSEFDLCEGDVIILSSAYINELKGLRRFQSQHRGRCPRIVVTLHQLYPPSTHADDLLRKDYQSYWLDQLRAAARHLSNRPTISYWTPLCAPLNAAYRDVLAQPVGMLPFVFVTDKLTHAASPSRAPSLACSFLGDGRQEKGLLILLEALAALGTRAERFAFTIQVLNLRGYSDRELYRLNQLLSGLQDRVKMSLIEGVLAPERFWETLVRSDVVCLPYHPGHYSVRASLVFVQALAAGVPVVASAQTWMGDEIASGRATGMTFDYRSGLAQGTCERLASCLVEVCSRYADLASSAAAGSRFYRSLHSTHNYFWRIKSVLR